MAMPSAPTAATSSAPAGAPAAPGTSLLTSPTTSQSPAPQESGQPTDAFLQLFAGMINATGNVSATASATPQDLAALPLECDADALIDALEPGEASDTDTDDSDADSDEAGALAIAALLPSLVGAAATASGGAASQQTVDGARVELVALTTARVAAEATESAVDALSEDSSDAAGNPSLEAADPSTAATQQNAISTTAHVQALLSAHAAAATDAAPEVIVQAPVGSPQWKDEVGTHIMLMAVNGREAASLRLSPEHLGPVEVRISVDDGKASVFFGAANADTRSALEQSLPRLRELFATQGLVLADAGVSRDAPRNQFKPGASQGSARSSSDAASELPVKPVTLVRVGLIDTYV